MCARGILHPRALHQSAEHMLAFFCDPAVWTPHLAAQSAPQHFAVQSGVDGL